MAKSRAQRKAEKRARKKKETEEKEKAARMEEMERARIAQLEQQKREEAARKAAQSSHASTTSSGKKGSASATQNGKKGKGKNAAQTQPATNGATNAPKPQASNSGNGKVSPVTANGTIHSGKKNGTLPRTPAGVNKKVSLSADMPSAGGNGDGNSKGKAMSDLDEIFAPKDGPAGYHDADYDRDVEEFKRFCAAAAPVETGERKRISLNLNFSSFKPKPKSRSMS